MKGRNDSVVIEQAEIIKPPLLDLGAITAFRLGSQPDGDAAPNVERLPVTSDLHAVRPKNKITEK